MIGTRRRAKHRRPNQVELPAANNQHGTMSYNREYCNARYWGYKLNTLNKYTKWCHDGKISLGLLSETLTPLRELLTRDTREAKNGREHMREYNSAMAFVSMGAEIKSPPGNGPYCI